ncbi:hypothetical protein D0Y65_020870 [Glycine soja]|uniref:Uncharacterized protein n=1 Tax=Glycine soja TaxID=3848 RepID=A0A445JG56_GLYSO|nr:hypothetical protein D0Y65_020870 [Glycine soja]
MVNNPSIRISHWRSEFQESHYLSSLSAWLVGILSKVPSVAANMPKRVLLELLCRCLLTSQLCNKQLVDSTLQLAELIDERYLVDKVQKFFIDFKEHFPS